MSVSRGLSYLVGRFIKPLSIDGYAKSDGDTWAEDLVIGQSGNPGIVYFCLIEKITIY